jgi:UDP-N-acetylmuramoyl-L-alanyl-D-glutamate--2,6-diaminopimelate ligase
VTRDGDPIAVFVDYAHTDDALRTVLTTLRESMRGGPSKRDEAKRERKLICVFGCGGDRDRSKRPRMGSVAAELADQVVVTSDNPRTEDPDVIIQEILGGMDDSQRDRVTIEPDRERAIRTAIRRAVTGGGGDVVVIAGKGHEDYQIVRDPKRPGQTVTRHFDDREVARDALRARGIAARQAVPLCGAYAEGDAGSSPSTGDVTDVLFENDQM